MMGARNFEIVTHRAAVTVIGLTYDENTKGR